MRRAQVSRQILQRARRILPFQLGPPLPPVLRVAERRGNRQRQLVQRLSLGTKRRQHDPVVPVLFQPRRNSGPQQRRLARSRCAQHHHQLLAALHAPGFQPLNQCPDVIVAPEVDRGVSLLEGHQSRIGQPLVVPVQPAARVQCDARQLRAQPVHPAFAVLHQVQQLNVVADELLFGRRLHQRENRLAQRPRLRKLHKAPLALEPVRSQDQDHRIAGRDLAIQRALPLLSRSDAPLIVEIEKCRGESLGAQPLQQLCRFRTDPRSND